MDKKIDIDLLIFPLLFFLCNNQGVIKPMHGAEDMNERVKCMIRERYTINLSSLRKAALMKV